MKIYLYFCIKVNNRLNFYFMSHYFNSYKNERSYMSFHSQFIFKTDGVTCWLSLVDSERCIRIDDYTARLFLSYRLDILELVKLRDKILIALPF